MKKFFVKIFFVAFATGLWAQPSITYNGEFILSFVQATDAGQKVNSLPRFTCFFHSGMQTHQDLGKAFGFFSGVNIRNIGFITVQDSLKLKRRSYSLGIPLAVKLGNVKKHYYFFGGAEYEMLFHYKEKQFIDGVKRAKQTEWFSDKVNTFIPSVLGGIQFPTGLQVMVKYYLNDFMNKNYSTTIAGVNTYPYRNFNSRIFYISVCSNIRWPDVQEIKKKAQPVPSETNNI